MYTLNTCPFPKCNKKYGSLLHARSFLKSIDVLLVIVDGPFYFFEEKFTILPSLFGIKKPVVWLLNAPTEEGYLPRQYTWLNQISGYKRRVFSSFVDECVSVSDTLDVYAKRYLLAKSYAVIPNGANTSLIKPKKRVLGFNKKYRVLWAGSGEYKWQAIDIIVEVARLLLKQSPSIEIQLVTTGSWYPIPKLENLKVLRSKNYFHVPEIFQRADAVLCVYHSVGPYGFYNSPLKLFDAMAAGLPVIGSNIGQIKQVISHKKNGLLTDNSPQDIVSLLRWLHVNPLRANNIGCLARKTITEYYNWNRAASSLEQVLKRVVNK